MRKLLIANRGEVARRIARTAHAMGIRTVAVFAADDRSMPFVREADEAIALGGPAARETYLDGRKLVDCALRAGADAVHPGYGFLSENADFARQVLDAGLTWVGPQPSVIRAMGDKLAAKALVDRAGVPVLPSMELTDQQPSEVVGAIGLPLLIKAAAGGGGRGMRVATTLDEVQDAVRAARREALAAFGDATIFAERYVRDARHIEVQVIADSHGNVVHCFERECSIQRRHQKVIEEAPAASVTTDLRRELTAAAVAAARAVGYTSVGTVEFLVADDESFYFLEMNTRLQVEHPVTEAVTGLDLVRAQLLVADGSALAFTQEDVRIEGHAIEARLYAEDPANGFLPSTGVLHQYLEPCDPRVRFDCGVDAGCEVGVRFDPMLAKVIAHAGTRREAAARLALALERTRLHGVTTNRDFLVSALRSEDFLHGRTTTEFISSADVCLRRVPTEEEVAFAAIAAVVVGRHQRAASRGAARSVPPGWRNGPGPRQVSWFRHGEQELEVRYEARRDSSIDLDVDGRDFHVQVDVVSVAERMTTVQLECEGFLRKLTIVNHDDHWWVHGADGEVALREVPRFVPRESGAPAGALVAPLPGVVVSVDVAAGDRVASGQTIALIEAMKMEHRISAPSDGHVAEVRARVGDQVAAGDLLVVVEGGEET